MLAFTSVGALHSAIARVKVATHAQVEAVGLVGAQKLGFGKVDNLGTVFTAATRQLIEI